MIQKILPLVLFLLPVLGNAQQYKKASLYRYHGNDSFNKELTGIWLFDSNGNKIYEEYNNMDDWDGKYYNTYKDTLLIKRVYVYPNGDSSIDSFNYAVDIKGRIIRKMNFWRSNHKFVANQPIGWTSRSDTTLFSYNASFMTQTCPSCKSHQITRYDGKGRVIEYIGRHLHEKYSYTNTTQTVWTRVELPYRPLSEYTKKYTFKHDAKGRIIEEREYYDNELSVEKKIEYLPTKKIEKEIQYPAIKTMKEMVYVRVYE